jgi:hypothetical protein
MRSLRRRAASPYYHNYEKLYVQRADAAVLSVLSLTDVYSHGAHGSVVLRGCNYDPATGNELKIDDVFTDSERVAGHHSLRAHRSVSGSRSFLGNGFGEMPRH